jgi:hypothetical protein
LDECVPNMFLEDESDGITLNSEKVVRE